jgi:hypothetical protein
MVNLGLGRNRTTRNLSPWPSASTPGLTIALRAKGNAVMPPSSERVAATMGATCMNKTATGQFGTRGCYLSDANPIEANYVEGNTLEETPIEPCATGAFCILLANMVCTSFVENGEHAQRQLKWTST